MSGSTSNTRRNSEGSTTGEDGDAREFGMELEDEDVLADATGPAAKKAAALATLRELFPNRPDAELSRAVTEHKGNLDAAAASLAQCTEADEQLARSLQAAESDERYARSLHASQERRARPPFRPTTAVLSEAVAMVRDVVVPSVHQRLKSLSFSNVTQQPSPTMRYSLRDVGVVALSLPADNVTVRAGGGVIRVHLVNMYVSISVGAFSYESTGLLPWNDTGALDASVAGLTAVATLRPGRTTSGAVALTVRDIRITVDGAVRVRTRGSSADWAYNTLAAMCKPFIVSYIKESVEQQLRTSLQNELRDYVYFPEQEANDSQTPSVAEPATSSAA